MEVLFHSDGASQFSLLTADSFIFQSSCKYLIKIKYNIHHHKAVKTYYFPLAKNNKNNTMIPDDYNLFLLVFFPNRHLISKKSLKHLADTAYLQL